MPAVIFMQNDTDIAIFYQEFTSPVKNKFCLYIFWITENWIETYKAMLLFCF